MSFGKNGVYMTVMSFFSFPLLEVGGRKAM